MKKITLFKGALAFTAASLIGASAAHAQFAPNPGDLIFNIYNTNTTSDDLEVDLGAASNFLYTGGEVQAPISLSNVSTADLATNGGGLGIGSTWYTAGLLEWAVLGANGNSSTSAGLPGYAVLGTRSSTLDDNSTGTVSIASNIAGYVSGLGAEDATATANSNGEGIFDSSSSDFYSSGGASSLYFGFFPSGFEANVDGAPTSLGLYEVKNVHNTSAATEEGVFTLSSSGLTYQAVPEPSTWATILVGAATLLGFRRRRNA